ncbi:MAG: DUF3305 domain-containing protein [Casimicrobiaceae bacterium]
MTNVRFPVAILIERVPLANRWVSEQWRVAAVAPHAGPAEPPRKIVDDAIHTQWCVTGHALELNHTESEGYYLNLSSPEPKVFVMWRSAESDGVAADDGTADLKLRPHTVTVSYNVAGRLLDGGEHVDAVAMAQEIFAWMEPFVIEHYKPEVKRKSRRNPLYEREGATAPPEKTG